MAVSETIQEILTGIDEAQYGRDMRQYIHKGIQKCYEEGSAGETDLTARSSISAIFDNLATAESSTTASKAYNIGDYLVLNNILYRVTADISQGGTIIPNTNVVATSIGDQLSGFYDIYKYDATVESVTNVNPSLSYAQVYIIPALHVAFITTNIVLTGAIATYNNKIITGVPIPWGGLIMNGYLEDDGVFCVLKPDYDMDEHGDLYGYVKCDKLPSATAYSGTAMYIYGELDPDHPLSSMIHYRLLY